MHYYDPQKNWRKLKRYVNDDDIQQKLYADMLIYTRYVNRRDFQPGDKPCNFEISDWRCDRGQRGRLPAYWDYVCGLACHWLVNFNLMLAMRVEPDRPWRIVTSAKHSTVWDGDGHIFDLNFHAKGIPAAECYDLAKGRCLKPGRFRKTNPPVEQTLASKWRYPDGPPLD